MGFLQRCLVWVLLAASVVLTGGCKPHCGDYLCEEGEDACTIDCHPTTYTCGDGICSPGEPCFLDCNSNTDGGITASTCWTDAPVMQSASLGVNYMQQSCQMWCWSAVSTMIAGYYGISTSQCVLMSIKAGFNQPTCCNYSACSYQTCDSGAQDAELTAILNAALQVHAEMLYRPLTETEIVTELTNGRPVIIAYQNSFAGHVVLIVGFDSASGTPMFSVYDPANGTFSGLTYNNLVYGYMGSGLSWIWSRSWYRISPVIGNCPSP